MTSTAQPIMPQRTLGRSGVRVPALGVGTNRRGLGGRDADELPPAFRAALDAGANVFVAAEVYLRSGKAIGDCVRRDPRPALVVTKFAPYPTRTTSKAFHSIPTTHSSGATSAEHLRGNVRAVGWTLSDDEPGTLVERSA